MKAFDSCKIQALYLFFLIAIGISQVWSPAGRTNDSSGFQGIFHESHFFDFLRDHDFFLIIDNMFFYNTYFLYGNKK